MSGQTITKYMSFFLGQRGIFRKKRGGITYKHYGVSGRFKKYYKRKGKSGMVFHNGKAYRAI